MKEPAKKKKYFIQVLSIFSVAIALTSGAFLIQPKTAQAEDAVVYKSPNCGCCKKWINHLEKNDFSVEAHNQTNLSVIKTEAGVPKNLRSCHTAKIGGYIIEGHVPADVIARLLKEKPAIKGLAVPGMPMGSPGMEGPRKDAYQILSFTEKGEVAVYATR